jgi:hypothetical protein
MANMYEEMVRLTAPDQLSLLNLFQPGVRQYLGDAQSPSLLNFQPPQRVPAAVPYVPMADAVEEVKKEPETLTVDTGGPEMAQAIHPAVLAFLDNEAKTPGARDARMGAINNALMTPMAAMGLLGDKATNALSLLVGQIANAMRADKGVQDGRNVPVVDMQPTSYAPGSLAEGVVPGTPGAGGYSVGTHGGYGAIGLEGASPDSAVESGSFGISVI